MELPKLQNAEKYVSLYVVDFGVHCGVGFTAEEVAELLDSDRFSNLAVYRIYRAFPDGRMELKGVRPEIFQLEAGMFFYANDEITARSDYKRLIDFAVRINPPVRAKVHLSRYGDEKYVTAIIYPAEYDDMFSRWFVDGDYRTTGAAEGGIEAVGRYYRDTPEVLERHQLFGKSSYESRTGAELLSATGLAIQR